MMNPWSPGAWNKVSVPLKKGWILELLTDLVMVLQQHPQTREAAGQLSLLRKPGNSAAFPFVSLFQC